MPRFSSLICLLMVSGFLQAQDYTYTKVWRKGPSSTLSKLKLLPSNTDQAYFLYPRDSYFEDQVAWDWYSEEGGILRAYLSDNSADSLSLVAGQIRYIGLPSSSGWLLSGQSRQIKLWKESEPGTWTISLVMEALPGTQTAPRPVPLLKIEPHIRVKNRFTIETLSQMESIPESLLEFGIILAMLLETDSIVADR